MKFVLTSLAVPSHLWTMIAPTARLLRSAGHEVAIATGSAMSADVARIGVSMISLESMLDHAQLADEPDLAREAGYDGRGGLLDPGATPGSAFGRFLAGVLAERAAAELIEKAADWPPDLVVRESLEFAGVLLAEHLGVPLVTLDIAPLAITRDPDILPWLNRSRAALGLPVTDDLSSVTNGRWAGWLPPDWKPSAPQPGDYRHYQAPGDDERSAVDPGGRPFVLAAFGSLVRQTVGADSSPMHRIVEALGGLACTAVVALGDNAAVASWTGPRPANVKLTGFADQRLLLRSCDLLVTHAGFGSLREALTVGVPMVALPLHSEQPENAQRLAELGVAVALDPADATPEEIRRACVTVMFDPRYRTAATKWHDKVAALPTAEAFVRDLETLAGGSEVKDFTIDIPGRVLDDLRGRLRAARLPDQLRGTRHSMGFDGAYLREILDYWADDFDWRVAEERLNRFANQTVRIAGTTLHFVHARSPHRQALPLLMLHGWPSSYVQMLDIIPMLTHPTSGRPSFDVIAVSLPGYGFSEIPKSPGMTFPAIADLLHRLMSEVLGYGRYGIRASDLGFGVANAIAAANPAVIVGIHASGTNPTLPAPLPDDLTEEERRFVADAQRWNANEMAYLQLQASKPQTLGAALNDSPAGLAAWIGEKFWRWTDNNGAIEDAIHRDAFLTNLTIYWATRTITSSIRLYYEAIRDPAGWQPAPVPIGYLMADGDMFPTPRSWVERQGPVAHWTTTARGGHFLEWEQPQTVAADLHGFFGALSPRLGSGRARLHEDRGYG
ncbi:alpha/beta fold hydrolase [Mangrovihabitans endophyticus]|uniref:alpha/beta fold hydrolase n=1 Tax=Mangrovihabitans endophyticus TaxID=1751298 RepID=UPI001663AA79|nr:alpha/beta fold hydrolase [Mangrovihabitans endophyticus]